MTVPSIRLTESTLTLLARMVMLREIALLLRLMTSPGLTWVRTAMTGEAVTRAKYVHSPAAGTSARKVRVVLPANVVDWYGTTLPLASTISMSVRVSSISTGTW